MVVLINIQVFYFPTLIVSIEIGLTNALTVCLSDTADDRIFLRNLNTIMP